MLLLWQPFGCRFYVGIMMYKCIIVSPSNDIVVDSFMAVSLYEARQKLISWQRDGYLCHVYDEFGDPVHIMTGDDSEVYEPSEFDEWYSYDPDC